MELLNIPKKNEFFNGSLGTWDTDPVELKMKEGDKTVCSLPYPSKQAYESILKKYI